MANRRLEDKKGGNGKVASKWWKVGKLLVKESQRMRLASGSNEPSDKLRILNGLTDCLKQMMGVTARSGSKKDIHSKSN